MSLQMKIKNSIKICKFLWGLIKLYQDQIIQMMMKNLIQMILILMMMIHRIRETLKILEKKIQESPMSRIRSLMPISHK